MKKNEKAIMHSANINQKNHHEKYIYYFMIMTVQVWELWDIGDDQHKIQ